MTPAKVDNCTWCGELLIIVFEPDGDKLCRECANSWVRGEGITSQENERNQKDDH